MKKKILTLLGWGVLALTACAPSVNPPAATKPQAVSNPAALARQQVAAHLQEGRHQAALDIIEKERRRSGAQRLLEEEHLQVLNSLSGAGEKFFQAGEYELSGRAVRLLLNHFPKEQVVTGRLGISRPDLQGRLDLCAERLMAQGLVEYRAGNLPAAIDTWKKILTFHPAHDEAKNGIRTAETQLQNLRALP